MALTAEKILVISPESWGKSMLSKHHYALELAKLGNDVWFLLPPWADKQLALDYRHKHIHFIFDTYSVRGARFIPATLRKFIYRRIVNRMQSDHKVKFTLVWSFDNSRFFDLDCFNDAFCIHHMMDFHTDYQIERASNSADLCLGVTSGIVQKMKPYNPHSYFIQHGYAPIALQPTALPLVEQKIKALYTGNLLMPYINWPWLHALVSAHPNVHFFMAGSYGKSNLNEHNNEGALNEVKRIAENANVTLLGECLPGQLQSFFTQVDVLFFAYRSQEFPEILANSHKIMAYLASGKPIVCHSILEYVQQNDLLHMAKSLDDYVATFGHVVNNLSHYGAETHVQRRVQWAMNNTYADQIERVSALVLKVRNDQFSAHES
jgi:glycosyltransferase involved in cell wall biosynthesis